MSKLNFYKRIAEPKEMGQIEQHAFQQLSKQNYKRWLVPLVDHALTVSRLEKGSILDVACGPGLLTKELGERSKNFKIFGVDVSTHAIKLAKNNCKNLKNISFVSGNVYKLPFDNESFDLVICKDSLHHFDNLHLALKELNRVAKKSGYIYLQDLRRDLPGYLLKRSTPPDSIIKKLQFYSTRAAYTKHELSQALKKLKFRSIKIYTRALTKKLVAYYSKKGIEIPQLRESFQSRYVAIIKK